MTKKEHENTLNKELQKKATRRLKIIEGQVRGLARMVDGGTYCIDILTQMDAVREALLGVEAIILENHLNTHVVEQITYGKKKQAIAEILKVYRAARKNI
ncbi:MAG: metal-sensitive transcriptional regulator [Candidatus Yonathbacteria bacterium]|nr:metal-sensitive transcriptional regulator [Candidatus Yonathbacteria bacterium]